ncbi:MAG: cupin domain-containing protein [Alphaproteobacteria bacterium]
MAASDEDRAVPSMQIDNERVRVTRWDFAPGAATGYHRHEFDYVIIPLVTGQLGLTGPAGASRADLATGQCYFRQAGVEHDVKNLNDFPFAFVEVELKGRG